LQASRATSGALRSRQKSLISLRVGPVNLQLAVERKRSDRHHNTALAMFVFECSRSWGGTTTLSFRRWDPESSRRYASGSRYTAGTQAYSVRLRLASGFDGARGRARCRHRCAQGTGRKPSSVSSRPIATSCGAEFPEFEPRRDGSHLVTLSTRSNLTCNRREFIRWPPITAPLAPRDERLNVKFAQSSMSGERASKHFT
jgi:hypothetical protein